MKRRDFLKIIEDCGWYFKRHGANHDIYTNGKLSIIVGRHREIADSIAKKEIKKVRANRVE